MDDPGTISPLMAQLTACRLKVAPLKYHIQNTIYNAYIMSWQAFLQQFDVRRREETRLAICFPCPPK